MVSKVTGVSNCQLVENLLPLSTDRTKVVLIDLWKTIARGPYPEPILLLQKLLKYKSGMKPVSSLKTECGGQHKDCALPADSPLDCEFLRACLTISHRDPAKFVTAVAERFGLTVPDGAVEQFQKWIANEINGLCYFRDVKRELKRLRLKGFRLGLLSNVWPFPVESILADLSAEEIGLPSGYGKVFEHVILSCDVGYAKPDQPIFETASRLFGVSSDQCVMVGDNPKLDIQGALEAGIPAVHIDRYGDSTEYVTGVPVIRELSELYKLQKVE